ncbi:unnamed protein product, partial [Didymodactylos carnosus]
LLSVHVPNPIPQPQSIDEFIVNADHYRHQEDYTQVQIAYTEALDKIFNFKSSIQLFNP